MNDLPCAEAMRMVNAHAAYVEGFGFFGNYFVSAHGFPEHQLTQDVSLLGLDASEEQQNSSDEFTPEQFEQFKSCLSSMFRVYYQDHKYEKGGEAYFKGHSDRWPHLWTGSVGDFEVRTDQKSYSIKDLGHKKDPVGTGVAGGKLVVAMTDTRNPYINAIANDAGLMIKGREFLGVWVYELGNALSEITNLMPEMPADAQDRYLIGRPEAGAAFEDCVFGGKLNANGSVSRPR